MVKNSPANARDIRNAGSIPGLERSPGRGHGNPLQYSYLENLMDRGTCWTTVLSVAKTWTRLKQLSMHLFSRTASSSLLFSNLRSHLTVIQRLIYIYIYFWQHRTSPNMAACIPQSKGSERKNKTESSLSVT